MASDCEKIECAPASSPLTPAMTSPAMSDYRQPLYLRCEMKKHEHRAALTPSTAKQLLDSGFDVIVERDPQRIFDDDEYEQ